jgi:hypothetical protein
MEAAADLISAALGDGASITPARRGCGLTETSMD